MTPTTATPDSENFRKIEAATREAQTMPVKDLREIARFLNIRRRTVMPVEELRTAVEAQAVEWHAWNVSEANRQHAATGTFPTWYVPAPEATPADDPGLTAALAPLTNQERANVDAGRPVSTPPLLGYLRPSGGENGPQRRSYRDGRRAKRRMQATSRRRNRR